MTKHALLFLLSLRAFAAFAQKEDSVWLLGGSIGSPDSVFKSCLVDFSGGALSAQHINLDLPFIRTNTSLCDAGGSLLCYSNGENMYSRDYKIIEGGSDFYPNSDYMQGFPFIQGFLLLPLPGSEKKVAHIYGNIKVVYPEPWFGTVGYIKLRYAIADMSLNGGLGKVVQRDMIAETDTLLVGQLQAVRHGNGRDWWVTAPHCLYHTQYRYLLSPAGLKRVGKQQGVLTDFGLSQVCYSPDGNWYARFNLTGETDSGYSVTDLYHYDRCSGLLSGRLTKAYNESEKYGKPGGVAFSPSSRYLYVSRWDSLFQYDLQSPDILGSEAVVGVYDGFLGDYNRPTRFYSLQLAPDGRIYCCVSNNNSRYLHVIERPDEPGLACDFRQHAIRLPVFNNFLVPNMPYYRLGKWKGSPCDTIQSVSIQEAAAANGVLVSPNPASDVLRVEFGAAPDGGRIALYALTGQVVSEQVVPADSNTFTMSVAGLPNGHYFLRVADRSGALSINRISIVR